MTISGSNGSSRVEVHSDGSAEWSMTFVDTGLDATIAERLKAGIARNIWGDPGYYRITIVGDSIYKAARAALDKGSAAR